MFSFPGRVPRCGDHLTPTFDFTGITPLGSLLEQSICAVNMLAQMNLSVYLPWLNETFP